MQYWLTNTIIYNKYYWQHISWVETRLLNTSKYLLRIHSECTYAWYLLNIFNRVSFIYFTFSVSFSIKRDRIHIFNWFTLSFMWKNFCCAPTYVYRRCNRMRRGKRVEGEKLAWIDWAKAKKSNDMEDEEKMKEQEKNVYLVSR